MSDNTTSPEPAPRSLQSLEESVRRLEDLMQTGFQKMDKKLSAFQHALQEGLKSGVPTKYTQQTRNLERQVRELHAQLANSQATVERLQSEGGVRLGQTLQAISTAAGHPSGPAKTDFTELVREVVNNKVTAEVCRQSVCA